MKKGDESTVKYELRPNLLVPTVVQIPFERLANHRLVYYLFDADNTLLPRKATTIPDDIANAIKKARSRGWIRRMALISNVVADHKWLAFGPSRVARLRAIAESLDVPYLACVWPNLKPKASCFRQAATLINVPLGQTVVVGDQVSTDIVGGNRAGCYTILVEPLGTDNLITAIRRSLIEPRIRQAARHGSP